MHNLFKRLPSFSTDYSGICNAAKTMNCLIVLHGQGGCVGGVNTCDDFEREEGEMKLLFSKVSEIDVVTGNDEKILQQIEMAVQAIPCDFILVCGSPIPILVGVDWNAWIKILEKRTQKPVVAINSKGFVSYEEGERELFLALIQKFAAKDVMYDKPGGRVNVIGDTCLNGWTLKMRETFREYLKQEFTEIVFWNHDATMSQLQSMTMAECNIAVSASAIPAVKKLEELYGIPYRIGFPVGCTESEMTNSEKLAQKTVLLVGEQVVMNEVRRCLRREFGIENVTVASFFAVEDIVRQPGDVKLNGEDDYEALLKGRGGFDYICGDEALRTFGGFYEKFVILPHVAIGGCLLIKDIPNLVGAEGRRLLEEELGDAR